MTNRLAANSRPLTFTLTQTKHFNPPSVTLATGEESQHNIAGLSSFFASSVCDELPADRHSAAIFTSRHACINRLSSNHHGCTARMSAAISQFGETLRNFLVSPSNWRILNLKISCKFARK